MNTTKKHIALILSLLLAIIKLSAQNLSTEEVQLVHSQVNTFLFEYQKYATFSEDNISLSENYISQFKTFFQSNQTTINNNLIPLDEPEVSNYPEQLTVESYIDVFRKYYPNGSTVEISQVDASEQVTNLQSNIYVIIVKANIKFVGLFKGSKVHESNRALYFKIEFTRYDKATFEYFKISALQSTEPQLPFRQRLQGLHFGVKAISALNTVAYEDLYNNDNATFTNPLAINFGVEINYFFNNKLGILLGANYSKFTSEIEMSDYKNSYSATDLDGENYQRRIESGQVIEKQTITMLDIPIGLRYSYYFGKHFGLSFALGAMLSKPIAYTCDAEGVFSYKGYYETYNVELYDLPAYGFPSDKQVQKSNDLELNSLLYSVFASAGISVPLGKHFKINAAANYTLGLANLAAKQDENYQMTQTPDDYNSLLYSTSKSKLNSISFDIGISYQFSDFY